MSFTRTFFGGGFRIDSGRYFAVRRPLPDTSTQDVDHAVDYVMLKPDTLGSTTMAALVEWAGESNDDSEGWKTQKGLIRHPRNGTKWILNRGFVAQCVQKLGIPMGADDSQVIVGFVPEERSTTCRFLTFDFESGERIIIAPVDIENKNEDQDALALELSTQLPPKYEAQEGGVPVSMLGSVKGIGVSAREERSFFVDVQYEDFV